jgi:hypothetical protein
MPVAREILRLAFVTPNARFHEKVIPGPSFMAQSIAPSSIYSLHPNQKQQLVRNELARSRVINAKQTHQPPNHPRLVE